MLTSTEQPHRERHQHEDEQHLGKSDTKHGLTVPGGFVGTSPVERAALPQAWARRGQPPSPVSPSISSRAMSRCPVWRAYSCTRCNRIHCSCGPVAASAETPGERRDVGQRVRLDDRAGARRRVVQHRLQLGDRQLEGQPATALHGIAPRFLDLLTEEAPLEPPPFDVHQMVHEPRRGPTRWHDRAGQLIGGQALQLGGDYATIEVEVVQQHCPEVVGLGRLRVGRPRGRHASTRRARSMWKRVDSSRSSTWIRSSALW